MTPDEIATHLCNQGYTAKVSDDAQRLTVEHDIDGHSIKLVHVFPEAIERLPQFILTDASSFGMLAHVEPIRDGSLASICVIDQDSVSVNYDVPGAAYEHSLHRHLALLERALTDAEWNRAELLREFRSNWDRLAYIAGTDKKRLYFACELGATPAIRVKGPYKRNWLGIDGHYLGLDQTQIAIDDFGGFRQALRWDKRPVTGKSALIQLQQLEPAPRDPDQLATWYSQCIDELDSENLQKVRALRKQRAREYWLVFAEGTGSDRVWFAIQFVAKGKGKRPLPLTEEHCSDWNLRPVPVRAMDRESIVPRSGGTVSLTEKSVLLLGCGSVGSELAHRLASTGIGHITLSDPEVFSEDNLYRHTLGIDDIGMPKTFCLANDLRRKYPWIRVKNDLRRVQEYSDVDELKKFDLVVVAIGSPTIERRFHDFIVRAAVEVPVMNVWLEAYGIGGHATLDLPHSKGCLLCAYFDIESFCRGLSSNLNFLQPDQTFTVSMGGCGNLFLPYSAIASNHTATMAADLVSKYLLGGIHESSRVSWKGDSQAAESQGLRLTYRYSNFDSSFQVQPLLHPECDACDGQ